MPTPRELADALKNISNQRKSNAASAKSKAARAHYKEQSAPIKAAYQTPPTEYKTQALATRLIMQAEADAAVLETQLETLADHIKEAMEILTTELRRYSEDFLPITCDPFEHVTQRIEDLNSQIQALTPNPLTQLLTQLWEVFCKVCYALFSSTDYPETNPRQENLNAATSERDHLITIITPQIERILDIYQRYIRKQTALEHVYKKIELETSEAIKTIETLQNKIAPYTANQNNLFSFVSNISKEKQPQKCLKYVAQSLYQYLGEPTEANRLTLIDTTKKYAAYQKAPDATSFHALLAEANTLYELDDAMPKNADDSLTFIP
jgi:hypothetical protein